uniref:ATP synthase F(0) complex subunit e, mitochondrial n=1 Tax=Castor canadensis TaxID=51338 RepID=A0A8C0VW29_CASCN
RAPPAQKSTCHFSDTLPNVTHQVYSFDMAYGAEHYSYLNPWAEEERRIAAEEKKRQNELKWREKQLAKASKDSVLK